jgi:tetratricopeptide (TPR) repeat protein
MTSPTLAMLAALLPIFHDAVGVTAGDRGDVPAAIRHFQQAIALDPGFAQARFHLGLALERTGRTRDAIAEYHRALRLNPDLLEARYGLSSACATAGDLDGAVTLLRQVVAALPQLAEARYNLGLNLWNRYKKTAGPRQRSDLDGALDELAEAARLAPDRADIHAALGQLLADTQRLQAAVASLRKAVELSAGSPEYLFDLGLALRLAGDLDDAESQFRAVLKQQPSHASARRALGLVLRQKDDLPAAATELRAAASQTPGDAQAHSLLGSVLLKLEDRSAAIDALRVAVALDPGLTDARVMLAQALARTGRKEEAAKEQLAVERINAESAAVGRAMILLETAAERMRNGDRAAALAQLREAVEASPGFPEAHYRLGLALWQSPDDVAESEAEFQRVVDLDPDHARGVYQLGLVRARRGDAAGAMVALRRATELAPGLIDAQRELAARAWAREEWQDVLDALNAVVAWEPGDARAHYALARALAQQGKAHDAAREFAIAQRLDPALRDPR